jgi:hypothetical protein
MPGAEFLESRNPDRLWRYGVGGVSMQLGMSVYLFHLSSPIKLHGLVLDSLSCEGKHISLAIGEYHALLCSPAVWSLMSKTIGPAHSEFETCLDISLLAMFHEEMFPQ